MARATCKGRLQAAKRPMKEKRGKKEKERKEGKFMGDKQQSAYLFSTFSSQVPDFLKEAKSDSLLVQAWPCCLLRHLGNKRSWNVDATQSFVARDKLALSGK